MKTFYFTETATKAKFGKNVTQHIYRIDSKKCPVLLATHEYNTGSCMGDVSEALQGLVMAGVLPSKYKGKYTHDCKGVFKFYKL